MKSIKWLNQCIGTNFYAFILPLKFNIYIYILCKLAKSEIYLIAEFVFNGKNLYYILVVQKLAAMN